MGERNVRPVEMIPQSGTCVIAAVGESYYLEAFEAICGPRTIQGEHRSVVAVLLREPSNPHDPNSVAVYVEGRKVAHLSRAHAIEYRALVEEIEARGHYAACAALIRGGWDHGDGERADYGIWLDLPASDRTRPRTVDEALARIASIQVPPHRREALQALAANFSDPRDRQALFIGAAKIEVEKVLRKVASIKGIATKRKHLLQAIQDLQSDPIPDELQYEELTALKNALLDLEPRGQEGSRR
jgi:hypothetical protein